MICAVFVFLFLQPDGQAQTKKAPARSPLAAMVARGKAVYAANCLACHQADGSGVPRLNPPLISTSWVSGSKTGLIALMLNGSAGQVEIDGETYSNTMPSQKHLTDQQIADVLTYIRNSFGNRASLVTPTEVKAMRGRTK